MQRPLAEVISSQDVMLARAGERTDVAPHERVQQEFEAHLREVRGLLARRACFETLFVDYPEVIANPEATAASVARFVGLSPDAAAAMAAAPIPSASDNPSR